MARFGKLSILAALATFLVSVNAVFYTTSPAPGDLVTNGGFEASLAGWTQSGTAVLYSDPVNSFSGTNFVAFNLPTVVTQDIGTQASTTYILTFHARPPGTGTNNFLFTLNGTPLYSITNDPAPNAWVTHTYAFTTPASGPAATINTLGFSGSNAAGGVFWRVDDVSVIQLPVPCDPNFYSFDSSNGHIKVESGKVYPSPPTTDTSFPVISNDGKLVFNYKSDAISHTSPRAMVLGLSPMGSGFASTVAACQFTKSQAAECPATTDITFSFSQGSADPDDISGSLESLFLAHCLTRTPAGNTITYSGTVFTLYTDPYDLGNEWSELKPVAFTIAVPYAPSASILSPPIDVVSDEVSVSYLPVEVINDGTPANPLVQFSTIATTFYPFAAYGDGTKFTAPPSGPPTIATDPSGNGVCVLYQAPGQVAPATTYCDANPGICTVECTRTIPIRAPVCDMSGYDWTFAFREFVDFTLAAPATTQSSDPTWALFTEDLLFDSSPQWNVCPSAASPNYASFVTTSAIHGHFDTSTGNPVLETNDPVFATAPLNFGFEISINLGAPDSNGVSATSTHIYKATLTEVKVTGPHGDYYLVGSSAGPTVGGPGAGVPFVHGLSITPGLTAGAYPMTISAQANPSDPKFAVSAITFIPNQGDSGSNIFSNADGGGQTLTVTFAGVISLFADGSTPAKRDIVFRRQVRATANDTYADPSQVINSLSKENSTTIIIQVPSLEKAVNAATIIAAVLGALFGMCLLVVGFLFYRRHSKSTRERQLEENSPQKSESVDY